MSHAALGWAASYVASGMAEIAANEALQQHQYNAQINVNNAYNQGYHAGLADAKNRMQNEINIIKAERNKQIEIGNANIMELAGEIELANKFLKENKELIRKLRKVGLKHPIFDELCRKYTW